MIKIKFIITELFVPKNFSEENDRFYTEIKTMQITGKVFDTYQDAENEITNMDKNGTFQIEKIFTK